MNRPIRLRLFLALAALTALVTGCPHNEYTVDLEPRGNSIERTITFFCADGTDTNGEPKYTNVDTNQLNAIRALYPAGALTESSNHWTAHGTFTGAMPRDIGGSGSYSNYTTSLGAASIYSERFRGSDDLATATELRLRAVNALTDRVLAWSKMELGGQPHYADLRHFIDTDFRRDVKNLSLYWWLGSNAANERPNEGDMEYILRAAQYLIEHGWMKTTDLPAFERAFRENNTDAICRLVQRVVARKLGIPDSQPPPAALKFLGSADAMGDSWEKYLSSTPEYRHLLFEWRKQRALATWLNPGYVAHNAAGVFNHGLTNTPGLQRPNPSEVVQTNFVDAIQLYYQPEADKVAVNLSLPVPPLHTNGKWDPADGKVKWRRDIEQTNDSAPLPAFFFAAWSQPDESFQSAHFGKVLLSGDNLFHYCVWHAGLDPRHAAECDAFLASFQPGTNLTSKINAFYFSDEAPQAPTNTPVSDALQNFLKNTPP